MYLYFYFILSVRRLSEKLVKEKANNPNASLSFDKDDPDALDFVTATSNLRSIIFGIEVKSQFKVKGIQN
jgi:ubiquitin-like 1-activating enzyme E1 B